MRAEGSEAISLVAEDEEQIIGHVLFSPMTAPFPALTSAVEYAPAFAAQSE